MGLALGTVTVVCLGTTALAQGIYSCVDAKGRKITADRPIAECTDRTQQELTRNGTVKREVGPSLTAAEQAALQEKEKQAAEARARQNEEKRRDRALLTRYPNREAHDQERVLALAQVDEVIRAASKRTVELADQRKGINSEMEFYLKDPSKAPASLKRQLDENNSSTVVQKKFIADQEQEKRRVNMRFDEELVKLRQLWTAAGVAAGPAVAPAGVAKK